MPQDNATLLRRWFEDMWNAQNPDAADELLAPSAAIHEPAAGSDATLRPADFKAMARVLQRAVPDIHFEVEETMQDTERAAGRVTVTGTHTGPGLGVPPTGRRFRIGGLVMIHLAGGRTVEAWSCFDMLGLFEQLGIVERPAIG